MLNLVVAPNKYNSRAEKYVKKIVKYLKAEKVEYSVYFSESVDEVIANAKELLSYGENEFVIIGDDIIISTFLNGFKDLSRLKLGIIPTSESDDFARYLELETKPIQAIKNILNKNIEEIDLLIANNVKVVNCVTLGSSVEVFEEIQNLKWKNFITNKIAKAKANSSYNGLELTLSVKGSKAKTEILYEVIIANGGYNRGKKVSPLSNVKDGLFNLVYTKATSRNLNLKELKHFKNGEHIYNNDIKQQWLNNLKITEPHGKIKAVMDGKVYTFDQLEISIVEKGLKIYK